jgi:hypothetical protein
MTDLLFNSLDFYAVDTHITPKGKAYKLLVTGTINAHPIYSLNLSL